VKPALIIDMDGVLYFGNRPAPGLTEFIAALDDYRYCCLTNNSRVSAFDCAERLAAMDVHVPAERIIPVADAVRAYLADNHKGETAYVIGSERLREAVAAAGVSIVDRADVVVVGLDLDLRYEQLATATRALRTGAPLIVANRDPHFITEDAVLPGTGAIVAALVTATPDAQIVNVGKPNPTMFALALNRLGVDGNEAVVVGDTVTSDIAGGKAIGARTVLISGATSAEPDHVVSGLPELTALLPEL